MTFFKSLSFFLALGIGIDVYGHPLTPTTLPRLRAVPRHASAVAYDLDRRVVVAYDASGAAFGEVNAGDFIPPHRLKRQSGNVCANISADGVQSLPGWQTLHDTAVSNWGDGWLAIHTNVNDPSLQPQDTMNADACIAGPAQVTVDGEDVKSQQIDGSYAGTDGTVTLEYSSGTSSSIDITVTQESTVEVGVSLSVGFSFVDTSLNFDTTITNSHTTETTQTLEEQTTQSVSMNPSSGQTCSLDFNVQSCTSTGHASVQMVADGWVWFDYPDKRNGHWWWALNLADTLPDPSQRSTYMQLSTSQASKTNSNFTAACTGGDADVTLTPAPTPIPTA
ncbi:hypothetical protein EXIGLDRAFT_708253 [Exidia glandulosa HHB12029]|uniref:Concanavalin A-like lectin/glucanase n=1 Tax=Exidia glandulosa HHB12029 TaxID=1314781 RepID=A0A165JFU0_EXIGL|nr:hypothetical protein EXIGLDRAFT_708253 [Exidia glandulosa HHB12029]